MDLDVKYFLSFYKVTDSIWPLGGWVNIVSARCVADIPISFPFFCAVLIGLSFLLLCGIPLTLSPWIKILINLSVSLSSYSWKGKEREVEEGKGMWYMGSWDVPKFTVVGIIIVGGTAVFWCPLSISPLWA